MAIDEFDVINHQSGQPEKEEHDAVQFPLFFYLFIIFLI